MTDVPWKAPLNALTRMASGSLMLASNAMFWVRDDFRAQMAKASEDLDAWNRANFGPDAETMGKATQIIYGLVNILPEIAMYTSGTGALARLAIKGIGAGYKIRNTSLAVGSALFGTDMGIAERNRLINEGVDRDTANKAGLVSGGANALGVLIPAFLGSSRTMSAIYGATSNVGLNMAELKGIQYILEKQDYSELSKQYDLNLVDSTVSLVMGAAMGAAFWRNPIDIKYERAHERLYETYKVGLEKTGKFTDKENDAQAETGAKVVVSLARVQNIAPDKIVDDFAPKLKFSEDFSTVTVPGEYAMPFSQGNEWHMGPSSKRTAQEQIPVLKITEAPLGRKDAIGYATKIFKEGVKNQDSGFVLTASRNDMKKSAGRKGSEKERVFNSVSNEIETIAEKTVLVESHADILHHNPKVQGIHIFALPVEFDGYLWRVQLLVKDVIEPRNERTSVHTIDGIEIQKMENPPNGSSQSEGGVSSVEGIAAADNRQVRNNAENGPSDRTISLNDLLGGDNPYKRQDGKTFFDSVEESSRANGGVYYEPQEYKQTGWNGSPHVFDTFSLQAIGTGEGGQAHGYGLYFALARMKAERYREMLAGHGYKIGTKEINDFRTDLEDSINKASSAEEKQRLQDRLEAFDEYYAHNNVDDVKTAFDEGLITKESYEWFNSEVQPKIKGEGRLYKVDIPNDDVLLREEHAFNNQPKKVQAALRKVFKEVAIFAQKNEIYREQWYKDAMNQLRYCSKQFFIPVDVESAIARLAKEEGPQIFADGKKVLKRLSKEIDEATKKWYLQDDDTKAYYDKMAGKDKNGIDLARQDIIGESELAELFDIFLNIAERKYPYLLKVKGRDKFEFADDITGREIYEQIAEFVGGEKEASTLLNKYGVKGIRYTGKQDGECAVIWDEKSIKILEYFQREQNGIRGSFNEGTNTIKLTPLANLSTFSHEHSHWYLSTLLRLRADDGATLAVQEQQLAILNAFGIKSVDDGTP